MNVSAREKKLLLFAAVVFGLGLPAYVFILQPPAQGAAAAQEQDLEAARKQYDVYARIIKREPQIEDRKERIKNFLPSGDGRQDQDNLMSSEVFRIYIRHGISNPDVNPPRSEMIRGVEEYKYLKIVTKFSGNYERACKLLNSFDQHGYFINDLRINNPDPDQDDLRVEVELLRLVKMTPEEIERWRLIQQNRGRVVRNQ